MRTGAQRFLAALAKAPKAELPWEGPVVRRDPATYRRLSVHLTWRCKNLHCGHWTMNGAYKYGRCNFCNEPRHGID